MIASLDGVAEQVRRLRAAGKKVVFTNGCFDILHSGHIDLLRRARECGDALVVAINSDKSMHLIKDAGRPILAENERVALVSALRSIPFALITGKAAGAVRNPIRSLAALPCLAAAPTPATMTM